MRITNQQMIDNAIRHMTDNQARLAALQEKIASTKQFQSASENPSAASAALGLRSTLKYNQVYLETAQLTDDWMTASEHAMQSAATVAEKAIVAVTRGISDTLGTEERAALKEELEGLLAQAIDTGNTKHQGYYIFSGFSIGTAPFSLDVNNSPDPANPDTVVYGGDPTNGQMKREIGPGQSVVVNVNGQGAFSPLFAALIKARDALDVFNGSNDKTRMQESLTELQAALDTINTNRTENGARQRQVQSAVDYLEKTGLEIKSLLSQKEDLNMVEAISMLRAQETSYQASLEVGQRAISALNLFDVLR
jgi:flagellar hook-associated protein 3 FlgL